MFGSRNVLNNTNSRSAKLPIVLVLDTSSSMAGDPIRELNEGVNDFIEEIKNDGLASSIAEVCIVTFGGVVEVLQDFESVNNISFPIFKARGTTLLGSAVLKALDCLEKRLSHYEETGVGYYRPLMVLMTDGKPTDSIIRAVKKIREYLVQRKIVVLPVALGPEADVETLMQFTMPGHAVVRLKGLRFNEFFKWLSSNVVRSSKTAHVEIDMSETKNWAELLLEWKRAEPKLAWLEEIVLKYKILVDASALMQRNSDKFFLEILLPLLKKHNKKVIIPKVVKKELARHRSSSEKSPSAGRAEGIIDTYRREGLLGVGYDEGDTFPDQVFQAILAKFKLHADLAFVTNDNTLIEDLCMIYKSESVKTHRSMVVIKVTGNGYPVKVVENGIIIRPLHKPDPEKTSSGKENGESKEGEHNGQRKYSTQPR